MLRKTVAAAFAATLAAGAAFAYEDGEMVMLDVDGQMVEVDVETAAEACAMDEDTVRMQAETQAGMAVCTIDQATADEHDIEMEDTAS